MTDIVPQDHARARLKAAAAAEAAGDRKEAMAQLAEAFAELFRPYAGLPFGRAEAYGFGPTVRGGAGFPVGMGSAMGTVGRELRSNQARGLEATGKKVDDNLAQLNDVAGAMQRGMRVMAIGIDYARYNRFVQLTPKVFGTGEDRRVDADFDYAPTRQEYDDWRPVCHCRRASFGRTGGRCSAAVMAPGALRRASMRLSTPYCDRPFATGLPLPN